MIHLDFRYIVLNLMWLPLKEINLIVGTFAAMVGLGYTLYKWYNDYKNNNK